MDVQNEEMVETRLAGDETTLRIYADLMDEVRERVAVINSITENKMAWANQFVEEVLYLQVRLLCEQVAIGCLIAHGDVPTRKIMKSYEPSKIMAAMEELNPNFFPKPVKLIFSPGRLHLDEYDGPSITQSELVQVWNQCGAKVHKGSALKIRKNHGRQSGGDFQKTLDTAQKIIGLLQSHRISSSQNSQHLIAVLADTSNAGRANVWFAEAPE
ncbi:hypothetical protein FHT87_002421 [Rhizobium sp. BK316]|uniref:hypothetical protein n=1 Tax=Rhizobium sp. BK316 TaxID=2587053 RepID=UPI00161F970A|nr:hypothetical protein [Rhizobium sp. BK316]MBB3408518.1 hypothetical protein [Rhizobium sp. BK316]